MSTKESAILATTNFLKSTDRVLILNGTHLREKLKLAMAVVMTRYPAPSTVLFRANTKDNAPLFLEMAGVGTAVPRPGASRTVRGHRLYVDSINPKSWDKSPKQVSVAIVYPVGSMNSLEGENCLKDLLSRDAKKVILVTWVDNKDLHWIEQFHPSRATYDIAAIPPVHHAHVQAVAGESLQANVMKKLPKYASGTPTQFLVQFHCDQCGTGVWGRLNKPHPGADALRKAASGDYEATCLKCGSLADDNYNWFARK